MSKQEFDSWINKKIRGDNSFQSMTVEYIPMMDPIYAKVYHSHYFLFSLYDNNYDIYELNSKKMIYNYTTCHDRNDPLSGNMLEYINTEYLIEPICFEVITYPQRMKIGETIYLKHPKLEKIVYEELHKLLFQFPNELVLMINEFLFK